MKRKMILPLATALLFGGCGFQGDESSEPQSKQNIVHLWQTADGSLEYNVICADGSFESNVPLESIIKSQVCQGSSDSDSDLNENTYTEEITYPFPLVQTWENPFTELNEVSGVVRESLHDEANVVYISLRYDNQEFFLYSESVNLKKYRGISVNSKGSVVGSHADLQMPVFVVESVVIDD